MGDTQTTVQPVAVSSGSGGPAPWSGRVVAWLLDWAALSAATWLVAGLGVDAPTPTPFFPSGGTADVVSWSTSPWLWAAVVALLVVQGLTGQTPGKRVLGIAVVDDVTGRPVGVLRTLGRQLAHVLDVLLVVGYLRPTWQRQRRTFADSLVHTLVVARRPAVDPHRRINPVTAGAVVVCALGIGFGVPWSTAGDVQPSPGHACVPSPGGRGPVAGAAELSTDRQVERRLWVQRQHSTLVLSGVTWTYPAGSLQGADIQIRIDALDPADSVEVHGTTDGVVSQGGPVSEAELGDALARVDLSGAPASASRTTATMRVDGRPVSTCTLTAP